jgi:uncharacterized membrane protein
MAIGPVQLLVIGFEGNQLTHGLTQQLQKVRENNNIRLIDLLMVRKDAKGALTEFRTTDLSSEETERLGIVARELIGRGATDSQHNASGAMLGDYLTTGHDEGLTDQDIQDIMKEMPSSSAAAIVLFEHRWAAQLAEESRSSHGFLIAQGLITPSVLMLLGADLNAAEMVAERI